MKRWTIVVIVIIAIALFAGAGYWGYAGNLPFAQEDTPEQEIEPPTVAVARGDVRQTIIAPGKIVNYNTTTLAARTSGLVEKIHIHPGEAVEEGQLLLTLDDSIAQDQLALAQRTYDEMVSPAAVAEAEIALATAKQEHTRTRNALVNLIGQNLYSWENKLADAQADLADAESTFSADSSEENSEVVETAKSAVADAEKGLKNAQYYYDTQNSSKSSEVKVQEARARYRLAREKEREAELYLTALNEGVIPDGAGGARIEQLRQAIISLQNAQEGLEATKIYAPMAGTILSLDSQFGKVGAMVTEGTGLVQMADPRALEVLISVIEEDYPLIEVGQSVDLYFDALPDFEGTGKVAGIVPRRVSSDRPLYQVYISIDEVPEGLVDGMTADSVVILAQKKDVLVLPRALVHAGSDESVPVAIWVSDHIEEREVIVGLRGDVYIEILSGLEEGEKVVGQ